MQKTLFLFFLNNFMKVSIITVCYNSEATIQKTFDSVRNQTYTDIEYIVVDGKSKDTTVNIISSNQDIISKWISEPDKGLYDAMNKGIQMATGDIIGILNSDDTFYDKNVICNIVDFHTYNEIDVSVGNIVQRNEKRKIIRKYSSEKWLPKKLLIGYMPPHPSLFLKKELFDKYDNYRLDLKVCADYELITRFLLVNKINWKYSNIVTTSMLIGGLSSSGISSYKIVSKEIIKSLKFNKLEFNSFRIYLRIFFKMRDFLKLN